MTEIPYDIIVIGSGSGGLSVGLFMGKAGFRVLMVSKSDHDIGGDCLNDGCVPSKSFIHVAKIARFAREAKNFGFTLSGDINIKKVVAYVHQRQEKIRKHENAAWIKEQGIDIALGHAQFKSHNSIEVEGKEYFGRKIVIATGSKPRQLKISGLEKVRYYDNESIFDLDQFPKRLLIIGGGPIGIEIAQAMQRLGSKVSVVQDGEMILPHDDPAVTTVLLNQLKKEGITFYLNASVDHFSTPNNAKTLFQDKTIDIAFDAVFVAIGRELDVQSLTPEKAGIEVNDGKITLNSYLQTSNKHIFVCGDMAADLQFSHSAEFHARILLNNLFSPFKKKLNNDHMSWVTFTDPEIASFGLNEKQLLDRDITFVRLEQNFGEDDRAVTDNYQYGKMILFLSGKGFLKRQKILGGIMVAPNAGELIQELILANTEGLSINSIFNKIYPYPVSSRINQKTILEYKSRELDTRMMKFLKVAFKIFG